MDHTGVIGPVFRSFRFESLAYKQELILTSFPDQRHHLFEELLTLPRRRSFWEFAPQGKKLPHKSGVGLFVTHMTPSQFGLLSV